MRKIRCDILKTYHFQQGLQGEQPGAAQQGVRQQGWAQGICGTYPGTQGGGHGGIIGTAHGTGT